MAGLSLGTKRIVKLETTSLFTLPVDPFGSIYVSGKLPTYPSPKLT